MSGARGWARVRGSMNGGRWWKLKRLLLACVFVVVGVIGAGVFALAAPTGSDSTSASAQATTPKEMQYLCVGKSDRVLRYVISPSRCDAQKEKSIKLS